MTQFSALLDALEAAQTRGYTHVEQLLDREEDDGMDNMPLEEYINMHAWPRAVQRGVTNAEIEAGMGGPPNTYRIDNHVLYTDDRALCRLIRRL